MHATLETRIDRQLHEDKIVSPKPNLKKKNKTKQKQQQQRQLLKIWFTHAPYRAFVTWNLYFFSAI